MNLLNFEQFYIKGMEMSQKSTGNGGKNISLTLNQTWRETEIGTVENL